MDRLRQALMIQVFEREDPTRPMMVSAHVQVWRGKVHITTISLLEYGNLLTDREFDPSCIEQFASITSRITARLLDEELYLRIQHGAVHTLHDLQKEFPPPSDE